MGNSVTNLFKLINNNMYLNIRLFKYTEEEREKGLMAIKAYKEKLSHEERLELHKEAEAQIRNCRQYKEEFITEYLIEAKESDMIREHISVN